MDRLLINANVRTLDDAQPRASVIAVRGERIVAVGDDRLLALRTARTHIDDLDGALVLPGLLDAHLHWHWTSLSLQEVALHDVPSRADAVNRVALAAQNARPGLWLTGRGWAQGLWPDGAFPTAADLDPVTPNNPAYMKARSGHAGWANSRALALAGIDDNTPNPVDGKIQRDAAGHATGILLEGAMSLVESIIPRPTPEQLAGLMEQAQVLAWKSGLTGFHDYDGPPAFEAMEILLERGALGLRIVKNINDPYIDHAIRLGLRWGFGNDWLRLGGLKIFADGALGPRTAWMIEPYDGEPDNRGMVVTDKTHMFELVSRASAAGFPATIHAIGDQAVRDVLDVYAQVRLAEAVSGIRPDQRRHRIEHVQIIHPDDATRLAELDVIASMQPIHATSDYPVADRYWGKRAWWSYNARYQIDHGARVAFGSDSPIEPFEPLKGIHAAITRRRADGSPGPQGWYPDLRLTTEEAVRGFTKGVAYAGGLEDRQGQITPGYFADFTVLDRDIVTLTPADHDVLLKTQVLGTMVGGIWRHREGF